MFAEDRGLEIATFDRCACHTLPCIGCEHSGGCAQNGGPSGCSFFGFNPKLPVYTWSFFDYSWSFVLKCNQTIIWVGMCMCVWAPQRTVSKQLELQKLQLYIYKNWPLWFSFKSGVQLAFNNKLPLKTMTSLNKEIRPLFPCVSQRLYCFGGL